MSSQASKAKLPEKFAVAKKRMLDEQLVARGISDPRVLAAIEAIPRHLFVDEALQDQAYQDRPLSIGAGQTISQPYIVALMDQLLALQGTERVLEIGTGCGYQTAMLALLAKEVFSIERIKPLALKAIRNLKSLGIRNVTIRVGDGTLGWPERAPFDVITAAAVSPEIPKPFWEELRNGGRLIMPTARGAEQVLCLFERRPNGWRQLTEVPCRFVKLIGKHGY